MVHKQRTADCSSSDEEHDNSRLNGRSDRGVAVARRIEKRGRLGASL